MAEKIITADVDTQSGDTDGGAQSGSAAEKKYTDEDVNRIVKRNSEKEVNRVLKELGITDREEAKRLLSGNSEQTSALNAQLSQANERADRATLEAVLLRNKVKADKVEKAAKLIELSDCLDENGKFSREKADNAVKELLKDWSEFTESPANDNVGFQIGSDGRSSKDTADGKKALPSKSWNKFNH